MDQDWPFSEEWRYSQGRFWLGYFEFHTERSCGCFNCWQIPFRKGMTTASVVLSGVAEGKRLKRAFGWTRSSFFIHISVRESSENWFTQRTTKTNNEHGNVRIRNMFSINRMRWPEIYHWTDHHVARWILWMFHGQCGFNFHTTNAEVVYAHSPAWKWINYLSNGASRSLVA